MEEGLRGKSPEDVNVNVFCCRRMQSGLGMKFWVSKAGFFASVGICDPFPREFSLLIWHSFCSYLHNSWSIFWVTPSTETPCLFGLVAAPLGLLCFPWYCLAEALSGRRLILNQTKLYSVGPKIQVVYRGTSILTLFYSSCTFSFLPVFIEDRLLEAS